MKEEQDFLKGFMFAEQVLFGLSKNFDFGRVLDRLEAIARGDVLTGPTAAEAVQTMERQTGRPLAQAFRANVYGALSAAGVGDTDPRKAKYILESMGYAESDWAAPRQLESAMQPGGRAADGIIAVPVSPAGGPPPSRRGSRAGNRDVEHGSELDRWQDDGGPAGGNGRARR